MKKKSYAKICFVLSVPFLLSSIGYGSWLINSKEESVVVSGPKVQDVPVAYGIYDRGYHQLPADYHQKPAECHRCRRCGLGPLRTGYHRRPAGRPGCNFGY